MKTFKLSLSTPGGHKYEHDDVVLLTARLSEGEIGVMADHSPVVASLKTSMFTIKDSKGNITKGAIKGGIFNVTKDEVTMLSTNFCMEGEVLEQKAIDEVKSIEFQMSEELSKTEKKSLLDRKLYAELKLSLLKE